MSSTSGDLTTRACVSRPTDAGVNDAGPDSGTTYDITGNGACACTVPGAPERSTGRTYGALGLLALAALALRTRRRDGAAPSA